MISRRDNYVISSSAARGIVPPPVGLYFGFMLWRVCSLRSLLQFKVNGSFLGAVCGASMSLLYLAVLAFWRSFILLVLNYGPINYWRIFRILWMLLSILSDGFSLLVQGNCQCFGWSWQKNIEISDILSKDCEKCKISPLNPHIPANCFKSNHLDCFLSRSVPPVSFLQTTKHHW